jgi:hypothetical protein
MKVAYLLGTDFESSIFNRYFAATLANVFFEAKV